MTDTWLLFPYSQTGEIGLISSATLQTKHPKTWAHLKGHESALRDRESKPGDPIKPFDNSEWYRFGRNQNIDKQSLPKLIVAQTVPSMRVCFDEIGGFALNNVRVNGILPAADMNPWFLLGILNAPVADFVFRRIAKPKDGAWFEANKQFIAPLPIPPATAEQRAEVAAGARELQRLHTLRRDTLAQIAPRLDGAARLRRPETWLFHGLPDRVALRAAAPAGLDASARQAWAGKEYAARLNARYEAIRPRLRSGAALDATLTDGELVFLVDGVPVVERVFVSPAEAPFVLAQWKVLASTLTFSEKASGKALCDALRSLVAPGNRALVDQVVAQAKKLEDCEAAIRNEERKVNALVFALYSLTEVERKLVEGESLVAGAPSPASPRSATSPA